MTCVVHIADDSDDRKPASIRTIHADALAEGIDIGPKALCHVLAYDGNGLASLIVEIGESAAPQYRNVHSLENIAADQTMVDYEVRPSADVLALDDDGSTPVASS